MNVLDLGCGPGVYATELTAKGANVTAVDSSHEMVELTKSYPLNRPPYSTYAGRYKRHARHSSLIREKHQYDYSRKTHLHALLPYPKQLNTDVA